MTSLTAIFGNTRESSEETARLLELYWDRAELKKEFANLRDETFRLKDAVKTEQGRTARFRQKYEQLENLLLDQEWAFNVLAHYQLRALNQRCVQRIARFAEQLKQQREKRQASELLKSFNAQRSQELKSVDASLAELRREMHGYEEAMSVERHRLTTMNGFSRFFRRRSVTKALDRIADQMSDAHAREAALLTEVEAIRQRPAPDTRGLSIAEKRSINYMILSFAQQLFLQFDDPSMVALIREAGDKAAGAVRYGSRSDCEFLLETVERQAEAIDGVGQTLDIIKQRARLIGERAQFKADDEAAPNSESVATLFTISANGQVRERDLNLLGDNFWDVAMALSR